MPEYPNPAGGSMTVANRAEAESKGWTPSMGTFGSASEGDTSSSPSTPSAPNPYGGVDIGAITRGFAASSGMSQKQLDEQIREFDATLDWQKKQWELEGLPELAIKQRAQDLEEKKFAELTDQAHKQQAWVEEIGRRQAALAEKSQADSNLIATGQLDLAKLTQAQRNAIEQGQLGVAQGGLGLQTLQAAAGLSGPADWIRAANFTRGVQGSNLPGFINQLLSGQSTATLGGPQAGQQMSAPLTMGYLANQMGAQQPAAGGPLAAMGQTYPGQEQQRYAAAQSAYEQAKAQQAAAGANQGMQAAQTGATAGGMGAPQPGAQPMAQQQTTNESNLANRMQQYLTQNNMQLMPDNYQNNVDQAQQKLYNVYQQGGQALGPQALEGLTSSEMSMFTGGGETLGADVPGFLEQYKRSRIGQSSGALTSGAY